ncbi:MAG: hypothetical protein WCG47_05670, partial [Dermatophilaceae bacterium]
MICWRVGRYTDQRSSPYALPIKGARLPSQEGFLEGLTGLARRTSPCTRAGDVPGVSPDAAERDHASAGATRHRNHVGWLLRIGFVLILIGACAVLVAPGWPRAPVTQPAAELVCRVRADPAYQLCEEPVRLGIPLDASGHLLARPLSVVTLGRRAGPPRALGRCVRRVVPG